MCLCSLAHARTHTPSSQLTLSLNLPATGRTDLGEKKENYKTLSSPYLSTKLLRLCVFGGYKVGYFTFVPMSPFCNCHCGSPCTPKGRKVSGAAKGGAVERQ